MPNGLSLAWLLIDNSNICSEYQHNYMYIALKCFSDYRKKRFKSQKSSTLFWIMLLTSIHVECSCLLAGHLGVETLRLIHVMQSHKQCCVSWRWQSSPVYQTIRQNWFFFLFFFLFFSFFFLSTVMITESMCSKLVKGECQENSRCNGTIHRPSNVTQLYGCQIWANDGFIYLPSFIKILKLEHVYTSS